MPLRLALAALMAAAVIQTLAELWAGGPSVPAAVQGLMPARQNPEAAAALVLAVLAGLVLPALQRRTEARDALAAMAAGGLALNAVLQAAASLLTATMVPGTLAGLLGMLPAAVAVLMLLGRPSLRPAGLGMLLSPAVLLACWHLAARL